MEMDDDDLPTLIDTEAIAQDQQQSGDAAAASADEHVVVRRSRRRRRERKRADSAPPSSPNRRATKRKLDDDDADVEMNDDNETTSAKVTETNVRRVPVPPHRYTPLRENWMQLFRPIVDQLKLQVRFNMKTRTVEIQPSSQMADISSLQKAADFVRAFVLGFDVQDALALIRLDDLFLESFQVQDVKPLKNEHLSRAIGRIAGKGGRTKFAIENASKTRIILADEKIHILGSFQNIKVARNAICSLILGTPPSKVYGKVRNVAARIGDKL